jgi:hypothetical protein
MPSSSRKVDLPAPLRPTSATIPGGDFQVDAGHCLFVTEAPSDGVCADTDDIHCAGWVSIFRQVI